MIHLNVENLNSFAPVFRGNQKIFVFYIAIALDQLFPEAQSSGLGFICV
ncbi:hypothetical protein J3R74_002544 [Puniceicoccus vermicola]